MIAAAGVSGDALDRGRQVAIAVRDQVRQSVDLRGRFGRCLDLNPAADAVEDGHGIEGIDGIYGRQHVDSIIVIPGRALARTRNLSPDYLWIPGALVSRAPRNDKPDFSACRVLRAWRSARPVRRCCAGAWRR